MLANEVLITKVKNVKAKFKEPRSIDNLAFTLQLHRNGTDKRIIQNFYVSWEIKHTHAFDMIFQIIHDLVSYCFLVTLVYMASNDSSRYFLRPKFEVTLVRKLLWYGFMLALRRTLTTVIILTWSTHARHFFLSLSLLSSPLLILDLCFDWETSE